MLGGCWQEGTSFIHCERLGSCWVQKSGVEFEVAAALRKLLQKLRSSLCGGRCFSAREARLKKVLVVTGVRGELQQQALQTRACLCKWSGHGSSRLAGAHRSHALGRDRVIAHCRKRVPNQKALWPSASCYQAKAVCLRKVSSGCGSKKRQTLVSLRKLL